MPTWRGLASARKFPCRSATRHGGHGGFTPAEPQNFDDEELELLQHLTGEIDYAIEFLAKSERLEYLAYHNPVSGLYNRVAFLAKLQESMQGRRFSVAVVDISDFSAIKRIAWTSLRRPDPAPGRTALA
ncbi:MAG: GGDEF domain-containing protein [Xanthomonadales bacterium]|nr:GGDEF domain-containing protein [Xanthomonadales bacterium]